VKAGGLPEVYYSSDWLKRTLLHHGNDEQVDWVPEIESHGMSWADAYIGLRGARNPFEFGDIPADRLAAHRRAMGRSPRGATSSSGGARRCRTRRSRSRPG
jgi:aminopeptidase